MWQSSSARMRVINHDWSATKQRLHLQSVDEISRHSVLSEDRIQQCQTSSGSRHKDTDQCLSRHFLLQAPQGDSNEQLWHRLVATVVLVKFVMFYNSLCYIIMTDYASIEYEFRNLNCTCNVVLIFCCIFVSFLNWCSVQWVTLIMWVFINSSRWCVHVLKRGWECWGEKAVKLSALSLEAGDT